MKNPIHSIHFLEGRVVVFRAKNNHHYTPTRASLSRLTVLLRRKNPLHHTILPYPDGWAVVFHKTVHHHLNIVNNGGTVYPPPVEAKVDAL